MNELNDAFSSLEEQNPQKQNPDLDEIKMENEQLKQQFESLKRAISGETQDEWGFDARDVRGNPAPSSWDKGAKTIAQRVKEETKQEILRELSEKEKRATEEEKQLLERKRLENQKVFEQFDDDWRALVEEGELPDMSDDSKSMLKTNTLTDDKALKDPALAKRYDLIKSAMDFRNKTGKNISLYRYYKTHYKNMPGSDAPVFGSGRGFSQKEEEIDYDKIHAVAMSKIR